jgi:hypothetical protein
MNRGEIMSEEERVIILQWITVNKDKFETLSNYRIHHIFVKSKDDPFPIFTAGAQRMKNNQKFPIYDPTLPNIMWDIRDRIMTKEGLVDSDIDPLLENFIYILCKKGFIHRHRDPSEPMKSELYEPSEELLKKYKGMVQIRFNIIIQLPEKGGHVYYIGNKVDGKERCYVLCKSSIHDHWSDIVEDGERITFSFGFIISKERADKMKSFEGDDITLEYPRKVCEFKTSEEIIKERGLQLD